MHARGLWTVGFVALAGCAAQSHAPSDAGRPDAGGPDAGREATAPPLGFECNGYRVAGSEPYCTDAPLEELCSFFEDTGKDCPKSLPSLLNLLCVDAGIPPDPALICNTCGGVNVDTRRGWGLSSVFSFSAAGVLVGSTLLDSERDNGPCMAGEHAWGAPCLAAESRAAILAVDACSLR